MANVVLPTSQKGHHTFLAPSYNEVTKVDIAGIEPRILHLWAQCLTACVLTASAILLLKGKIHI